MNDRIFNAYLDYTGELARAGVLDHSLNDAILNGKSVEEHMIEVLRAAGKLPAELDSSTAWRRTISPRSAAGRLIEMTVATKGQAPLKRPIIAGKHARLIRVELRTAS